MLPRGGDVAGVEAAAAGYPFTTSDEYDGDGNGNGNGNGNSGGGFGGGGQMWRGRRSLPECGDSPVIRGFIPLVWVGGVRRDLARRCLGGARNVSQVHQVFFLCR